MTDASTENPVRDEDRVAPDDLATSHVCEGGNLDCGSGLLLLIRKAMSRVPGGQVLEIRSTEISVREDLPAWCRMTGNPYLGWRGGSGHNKYFVRHGGEDTQAEADYAKARDYRWQTRVRWRAAEAGTPHAQQAEVFCRNHQWEVGQPASFDVRDDAPSAVEYVLGALGACLVQGLQIRASQRGIGIDELEISLSGRIDDIFVFLGFRPEGDVEEDGEHPVDGHPGFDRITGTLYVQSDEEDEVLEALWREVLEASPVTQSLVRPVTVDVGIRVV